MSNTYSQIYIQIIFAVKGRQNLIPREKREELHKYIAGIVKRRNQKILSIFAMPDHVHLFVSLQPNIIISDLVRDIKAGSSKYISDNNWMNGKFSWQKGFGAFSYSKSQLANVVNYILNQEEHHKTTSFKEEYIKTLQKFEVNYTEEYLFEWIE